MGKPYTMKDLGYKRTPTKAFLRVTMEDGTEWDVPVQCIADDRDANYADDKEDTIGYIRAGDLSKGEITDWSANNMNWSDVEEYAEKADTEPKEVDFQEGWCNGEKRVVGTI